ncbi:hypothetical protein SAMN05428936_107135 [Pelagibacterium halotolerans]|nr:hypothetical protein SAMN05428936_107135 [Pelagibacterium halotolerans]
MIGFAEYRIGAQPGAQERKGRQGGDNKLGSWQDKSRTVRHGRGAGARGFPSQYRTVLADIAPCAIAISRCF